MEILFLVAFFLLLYSFMGYPVAILIVGSLVGLGDKKTRGKGLPTVMLMFPASYEGEKIKAKIENTNRLKYPRHKLKVVAVSDAATPETIRTLKKAEEEGKLKLLATPRRSGKAAAVALALKHCNADLLIVTDADTMLEPGHLVQLVRPFVDPDIGAATGIIRYRNVDETGISKSQGLYWRFELLTRKAESLVGRLIGVTGALYAVRPELADLSDARLDADFLIPLQVLEKKKKVLLLNRIEATDYSPASSESLFNRRTRMITLGLFSLFRNPRYLNPFRFPLLALQLYSHKILRWLLAVFMAAMLATNLVLALKGGSIWVILILLQALIYVAGLLGGVASFLKIKIPLISSLWYLLVSAGASVAAWFNLCRGKDYSVWEETANL